MRGFADLKLQEAKELKDEGNKFYKGGFPNSEIENVDGMPCQDFCQRLTACGTHDVVKNDSIY